MPSATELVAAQVLNFQSWTELNECLPATAEMNPAVRFGDVIRVTYALAASSRLEVRQAAGWKFVMSSHNDAVWRPSPSRTTLSANGTAEMKSRVIASLLNDSRQIFREARRAMLRSAASREADDAEDAAKGSL
jgi:hypothetical protein